MSVRVHQKDVKKALTRNRAAEPFWCARYRFSPYQNCEHGCLYCDGRAERYYMDGVFEEDISVRTNLPELLANELSKLREKGIISGGSGVSDIYQPIENDLKLTRECARAIWDAGQPAAIATKNALAVRDLDLWGPVARDAGLIFMMSIVTLDDQVRARFEPGASAIADRVHALRAFKEAGAVTGVLAMPLLPDICDSEDQISGLFSALKESGVDFIIPGGLTLRPGRQKDRFFSALADHDPGLIPLYERLYGENRSSGSPLARYAGELNQRAWGVLKELGLPGIIPHRAYRTMLGPADELHILFWHMVELYSMRGVNTRRLKSAAKAYSAWLDEIRKDFNRRRSLPPDYVNGKLLETARSGGLGTLLGNTRLGEFARRVLLEREIFDYLEMKLMPGESGGIAKGRDDEGSAR